MVNMSLDDSWTLPGVWCAALAPLDDLRVLILGVGSDDSTAVRLVSTAVPRLDGESLVLYRERADGGSTGRVGVLCRPAAAVAVDRREPASDPAATFRALVVADGQAARALGPVATERLAELAARTAHHQPMDRVPMGMVADAAADAALIMDLLTMDRWCEGRTVHAVVVAVSVGRACHLYRMLMHGLGPLARGLGHPPVLLPVACNLPVDQVVGADARTVGELLGALGLERRLDRPWSTPFSISADLPDLLPREAIEQPLDFEDDW